MQIRLIVASVAAVFIDINAPSFWIHKRHAAVLTAENVLEVHPVSREKMDKFALRSHERMAKAKKEGFYDDMILPLEYTKRGKTIVLDQDECPRDDANLESMAKLRPIFF